MSVATSSRTVASAPPRSGVTRTLVGLGVGVVVVAALFLIDAFAPTFFSAGGTASPAAQ